MIRRRYPVILGALAAASAGLALVTTIQGAVAAVAANQVIFDNSGQVPDEILIPYYQQLALGDVLRALPAWALLAGLIAAIAALMLVVLRSRELSGALRD